MEKIICIYHKNCADGFGAAWVVRKQFGESNVDFIPATYSDTPPDVTGRTVYIVDFSYKRPELLAMAEQAKKILILDHHASAQNELVKLPDNVTAIFDMQRSGAMMAWDYLIGTEAPALIRHIQDRDLWRFNYKTTKPFMAAIFSYPYDFKVWDDLARNKNFMRLIDEGRAILRAQDQALEQHIKSASHQLRIMGHWVPALNCPYSMASEAGNRLSQGHPFAATYTINDGSIKFSLRSQEDGEDVSKIAEMFGGGGHKHAAGFSISDFTHFAFVTKDEGYELSAVTPN